MFDFPASPTTGQIFQPSGGPSWQFDGVAWKTLITAHGVRAPTRTVFAAIGGPFPYTIPVGCTAYDVEVVGPGGGGGPTTGTSVAGSANGGGGGGAGGYARKMIQVTPAIRAAAKNVFVAAGGGSGATGGTSQYADGTNTVQATGGTGGGAGAFYNNAQMTEGGSGGVGSGGDFGTIGAPGERSMSLGQTNVSTGYSTARGGDGGSSLYGAGGKGALYGVTSSAAFAAGSNAGNFGAGGGGAAAVNGAASNAIGGAGSQGLVIFTEYYTGDPAQVVSQARQPNLVVNGAFQHNIAGSGAATTAATYFCDQWLTSFATSGTLTYSVSNTGTGGPNDGRWSGWITVGTVDASIAAGEFVQMSQYLEGLNIASLNWGTNRAKQAVLRFSFYSETGAPAIYCFKLSNWAGDRSCVFKFTHPGDGTMQDYEFVVPPITTGTWVFDNTGALVIALVLVAGTTYQVPVASAGQWVTGNFMATADISNTALAVTNKQFGLHSVGLYADPGLTGRAPPWEEPNYDLELLRCQRYYQRSSSGAAMFQHWASAGSQAVYDMIQLSPNMRAAPILNILNLTVTNCAGLAANVASKDTIRLVTTASASGICYAAFDWYANARM